MDRGHGVVNQLRLRDAMTALEEANRDAERWRLAWCVARVAHPDVLDLDVAVGYCEAANAAAEAANRYEEAVMDAQQEFFDTDMGHSKQAAS
jgi:hypothetical protein